MIVYETFLKWVILNDLLYLSLLRELLYYCDEAFNIYNQVILIIVRLFTRVMLRCPKIPKPRTTPWSLQQKVNQSHVIFLHPTLQTLTISDRGIKSLLLSVPHFENFPIEIGTSLCLSLFVLLVSGSCSPGYWRWGLTVCPISLLFWNLKRSRSSSKRQNCAFLPTSPSRISSPKLLHRRLTWLFILVFILVLQTFLISLKSCHSLAVVHACLYFRDLASPRQ